ncbi:MAG: phosphatidate cytidylyltransferase [Ramlibacter sp.]|nr:phosphatidate cytidylyltransferase [Ramlibacter sp.]
MTGLQIPILFFWGVLLTGWLVLPAFFARKSYQQSVSRVPVWAAIAALEITSLYFETAFLLSFVYSLAVCVFFLEILVKSLDRAAVVAGFVTGAILSAAALVCSEVLVALTSLSVSVLLQPYRPNRYFFFASGLAIVPIVTPFAVTIQDATLLPLLIVFLTLVHAADISAGFSGKLGGHRPFPVLSPNKTSAGLLGSFVFVCSLAVLLFSFVDVGFLAAFSVGTTLVLTSVCGDLVGSKIKRVLLLKDFSRALGVHGGFGDRLDSLTMSAPLIAYFLATRSI